jgi:hypothetical protein
MKESKVKHTKFNLFIWRKLPPCREQVKVITRSMDGRVSFKEWVLLKLHLLSCDPCVNFIKQLKFISGALHRHEERLLGDDSVHLSDDARRRMRDALKSPNSAA